jgi:PhnB protein
MLRCTPFLLFDGNCAEAMEFYHTCLGGELTLTKLGDTPMKNMFPPEKYDRIINAQLSSGDIEISATDWMSDDLSPIKGNMMSIFVIGTETTKLQAIFNSLSEDANKDVTFQELHELPFGLYGQLTDKFGVSWIFKGDSAPAS